MHIIPAIDLLDGRVVRLRQGRETSATVYTDHPDEMAIQFEEAGAQWLHVVDLDGAFGRTGVNASAVRSILQAVDIPVQLGGGLRTVDDMRAWIDLGVRRCILGSAAVDDPDLVARAVETFGPESVVAALDVRDGHVAVRGWTDTSSLSPLNLAQRLKADGLRRVVVTDIASDGMLTGPRTETTETICRETDLAVIVSGGVGSLDDVRVLQDKMGDRIEGVIIGRALYEQTLDLAEAIRLTGDRTTPD